MGFKYAALCLAAIIVAVFAVQVSLEGFTESFALVSSDVPARPWILLTSVFLHGGAAHLLGNLFALVVFGIVLENIIGSKKFLALYLASGIIASFISVFFYDSALGASGAIFGVLGALAVLRPMMIVWTYGVPMPMVAAAGFWLLLDFAGVFYPTNVANMAHIAGLIFGAAAGLVLLGGYRERRPGKGRRSREKLLSDSEFEDWEDEHVGGR